ncbi:MAG: hypothetical protein RLZZ455_874 [Candidatus Parcubacteria bacterium]|jgi:hypothetical protein
MSDWGQSLVDNLNYNVLIESLVEGKSLTPAQVITLFNLAKKRNSNIEDDIKNWESPL